MTAECGLVNRFPVKRLDQALNLWEQECFLTAIQVEAENNLRGTRVPVNGPLRHSQELRSHLLQSYSSNDFDADRFIHPDPYVAELMRPINGLPYHLFQWTRNSRRIFSLKEDLQVQLENTSLDGVHWSDVRFPFDAYGMELGHPIGHDEGPNCDFVLINKVGKAGNISVTMFPETLDDIYFLSNKERNTLNNLSIRRKWPQAYLKLQEFTRGRLMKPPFPSFTITADTMADEVLDTDALMHNIMGESHNSDEYQQLRRQYWQSASELVVGFCLYLKQLPNRGAYQSEWTKAQSTPDVTAITNEAEVCYITSTHPLLGSLARDRGESKGGYEMKWHFRRGYWSRRPGQGHLPDAPKVVWHPPQEIRADRKPPIIHSVPGGSKTET